MRFEMTSRLKLHLLNRFGWAGWEPVNVREYERHAQLMLSKNAFDYYASGANDMVTLRENRSVRITPVELRLQQAGPSVTTLKKHDRWRDRLKVLIGLKDVTFRNLSFVPNSSWRLCSR